MEIRERKFPWAKRVLEGQAGEFWVPAGSLGVGSWGRAPSDEPGAESGGRSSVLQVLGAAGQAIGEGEQFHAEQRSGPALTVQGRL